jgi:hypothetical protein
VEEEEEEEDILFFLKVRSLLQKLSTLVYR